MKHTELLDEKKSCRSLKLQGGQKAEVPPPLYRVQCSSSYPLISVRAEQRGYEVATATYSNNREGG